MFNRDNLPTFVCLDGIDGYRVERLQRIYLRKVKVNHLLILQLPGPGVTPPLMMVFTLLTLGCVPTRSSVAETVVSPTRSLVF